MLQSFNMSTLPTPTTQPTTEKPTLDKSNAKKSKREAPWKTKNTKKQKRKQNNAAKLEEARKNYESRSKGYEDKGDDGEVLDTNAPHPGSYAFQIYLTKEEEKKVGEDSSSQVVEAPDNNRKHPKRKLAFLLAFCGKNYSGMQMNPSTKTIQAEVEKAFFESEALSEANYGFPKKCAWSNSARTDKGVHAAAQVISAKVNVPTKDENLDEMREIINSNLPEDIKGEGWSEATAKYYTAVQND